MVNSRTDEVVFNTGTGSTDQVWTLDFYSYMLFNMAGVFQLTIIINKDCPGSVIITPSVGVDQSYSIDFDNIVTDQFEVDPFTVSIGDCTLWYIVTVSSSTPG